MPKQSDRMRRRATWLDACAIGLLLLAMCDPSVGAEATYTKTFKARDSVGELTDVNVAAQTRLDWVKWKGATFNVRCASPSREGADAIHAASGGYDALVTFPSPHPTGEKANDAVVMEWFAPRDEQGGVKQGPAMVVLHILAGRMVVARMFARGFAQRGIHAFVLHMPHYGLRRTNGKRPTAKVLLEGVRQAVADARRARDVINVLPNIDRDRIGIQGTSLGGFVCTGAASLDGGFKPVFPTLAGGNLDTLFRDGQKEVASIREHLKKEGITTKQLAAMLKQLEPNTLAHRIDAKWTWMFNAEHDVVIPPANALSLAKAIGIRKDKHTWLPGGHVSCAIHIPVVVESMVEKIYGSHGLVLPPKLKQRQNQKAKQP